MTSYADHRAGPGQGAGWLMVLIILGLFAGLAYAFYLVFQIMMSYTLI